MAHPVMFDDQDPLLIRLRGICAALPGVEEQISHGRPVFRAKKIVAVFGGSEKLAPGDHRQVPAALLFKPDPEEREALLGDDRFFVPAYYGPSGWLALDLADADLDWTEVAELVEDSYRAIAPPTLVAQLDAQLEGRQ